MRALFRFPALLALLFVVTGCGPTVDLKSALQIEIVSTGWLDAGIVNGQNKLVPVVSFRVKNTSSERLRVLQVNALFRRVTETDEWGSGLVTVAGSDGLAGGATSEALTIKSQLGYTGTEPRNTMLQNSQFVDAKVSLFAKYGSTQWTPVGDFPIKRQLLTP